MEIFYIQERITKEVFEIKAISWEIINYTHYFYIEREGHKIVEKTLSERYYNFWGRELIEDEKGQ